LDEYGWNLMNLRDRRYDAVLHLVTAAIGAEKYYTTENNTARTETVQEARELDFRILNAWVGHPNIRIIDNSVDFQEKMKRVVTLICQIVGAPKPVSIKRKFLIKNGSVLQLPVKYEQFESEQTYLVNAHKEDEEPAGFTFIRRRGQNGSYHYTYSMSRDVPDHGVLNVQKTILERQISGRNSLPFRSKQIPLEWLLEKELGVLFTTINTFNSAHFWNQTMESQYWKLRLQIFTKLSIYQIGFLQ